MATGRVPTTANSPLTAKGDLFGYSTTQARVAVGNDGETLVADSSASVGIRYQANFAAGKNAVINGDCRVAQRGSSVTSASTLWFYGAVDRFLGYSSASSTATISQQAFTAGTAPVAGYEAQYFVRSASTSTATYLATRLEDVRTFAGQTVTLSFWAKTDVAQTLSLFYGQNFGSGGSANVDAAISPSPSLTTSWTRFTATFAVPSISGKTIGAGSFLQIVMNGAVNKTIDVWGLQLEAGSVATAFQTATGTIQGELAACQRYYYRLVGGQAFSSFGIGNVFDGTRALMQWNLPNTMRVAPTVLETTGTASNYRILYGSTSPTTSVVPSLDTATTQSVLVLATVASGMTAANACILQANNTTTAYLGVSAEL
jgi:hypothetical protein